MANGSPGDVEVVEQGSFFSACSLWFRGGRRRSGDIHSLTLLVLGCTGSLCLFGAPKKRALLGETQFSFNEH